MEVYEVVKSIGSGSFGQVYLVKHKREDKLYVIKKIKTKDMQQKDRENTEQEVRLLQKLRHTNIVAYKDSYLDQDQFLNIVMIYCEGGDMYNKIRSAKGKNFPESQVLDWFAQMALALYYLHNKKILHRDLKTQNIFLKHGRVRLGDFGIAKVLDSTKDFANTCIGTPYYMSPELFKYKPYSYKSDVWALGCVMYEICNLRHAFDAQSFQGLAAKIIKGSYPPITSTYSKQLRDLIGKMLCLNPKDRPTITDVLQKPIIKRRVVNYMAEIFMGKYPEANLPNDVDDIYIDSLKQQAEKLGLTRYIEETIQKSDNPEKLLQQIPDEPQLNPKEQAKLDSIQSEARKNKQELKKISEEKKKIESLIPFFQRELRNLERKESLQAKIKSSKSSQQNLQKIPAKNYSKEKIRKPIIVRNEEHKISEQQQPAPIEIKKNSEPSYLKKKKSIPLYKENRINSKPELPEVKVEEKEPIIEQKPLNFQPSYDDPHPLNIKSNNAPVYTNQNVYSAQLSEDDRLSRDRASEKEKKRKEEQERYEKELHNIRMQNYEARILANQQKQAQYRPSNDILYSKGQAPGKSQSKGTFNQYSDLIQEQASIASTINDRDVADTQEYKESPFKPRSEEKKNSNYDFHQEEEEDRRPVKIEEDYDMNEDAPENDEEEQNDDGGDGSGGENNNEEEIKQIREKIDTMREQLIEKTSRMEQIKQTLKKTLIMEKTLRTKTQVEMEDAREIEDQIEEAVDQDESYDLIDENDIVGEEDEEDENDVIVENSTEETSNQDQDQEVEQDAEKKQYHPQYYKIQDRIKLLRHRCEAGIGHNLYEKAYTFLSEEGPKLAQEDIRKNLIDILGEENIGFWHLIDQILLFEGFAKKLQDSS